MLTSIGRHNLIELIFRDLVCVAIDSIQLDRFAALVIRCEVVLVSRLDVYASLVREFVCPLLDKYDLRITANDLAKGLVVADEAWLLWHILRVLDVASVRLARIVVDHICVL